MLTEPSLTENKKFITFKKTTMAITAPRATGASVFIGEPHCFGLNITLGIVAIASVRRSYIPSIKASVPPETPGIALAIPITAHLVPAPILASYY